MDNFNGSLKKAAEWADSLMAPVLNDILDDRTRTRFRLELIKALRGAYSAGTKEGSPSTFGGTPADTMYAQRLSVAERSIESLNLRLGALIDKDARRDSTQVALADRINRLERNRYSK